MPLIFVSIHPSGPPVPSPFRLGQICCSPADRTSTRVAENYRVPVPQFHRMESVRSDTRPEWPGRADIIINNGAAY